LVRDPGPGAPSALSRSTAHASPPGLRSRALLMALLTALPAVSSRCCFQRTGHSFVAMAERRQGPPAHNPLFLLAVSHGGAGMQHGPVQPLQVAPPSPCQPVAGLGPAAGSHSVSHALALAGEVVAAAAVLNWCWVCFNLLPGLPLDGGLIVKAAGPGNSPAPARGIQVPPASVVFLSLMRSPWHAIRAAWRRLRRLLVDPCWVWLRPWGFRATNSSRLLAGGRPMRELKVGERRSPSLRVLESDASLRDSASCASRRFLPAR